jgi:hypothetical protein
VGVKFAAELLAMGIKMTLHIMPDHILVSIDIKNAYNTMRRAAILERHRVHMTKRRAITLRRAKLGPRSHIWSKDSTLRGDGGLHQGSPTSGPAFAFTIHTFVKEADRKLEATGGYVRFGMDDGYFVGPRKVVFEVLAEFEKGAREGTGCELVSHKCTVYRMDENGWDDCQRRGIISGRNKRNSRGNICG